VSAFLQGLCEALARAGAPGAPACLEAPPKNWWRRKRPKRIQRCYRVKSDALRVFLDENVDLVEEWGGPGIKAGCSEFDSVNRKYGFERSRDCARTIATAVWYALPGSGHRGGPPYCLDDIDITALNDTSPGRMRTRTGQGFRLPDAVEEARLATEEERYYRERAEDVVPF